MPAWWNWQTPGTQNPVSARTCGFDPRRRHHSIYRDCILADAFLLLFIKVRRPNRMSVDRSKVRLQCDL